LPSSFIARFAWDSLRSADACVAGTSWEAKLLRDVFEVPPNVIHVIPNGVEDVFFETRPEARGKWLVCTATITERKRVLETAEAAVLAGTPFWVIGKPYTETSPYAVRFRRLHEQHRDLIRFEGPIRDRSDLARAYRQARGFVLLSTMESLSLSAGEAAACQCPLLLADLPWARAHFAQHARYCGVSVTTRHTAAALRSFYDDAPQLPPPPLPKRWVDIGASLRSIYETLAKSSR
jgi:glycosyltransferase involved in cell wall biosynthesis